MLIEDRLAGLFKQLDKAREKHAEAHQELRKAERKEERASSTMAALEEEIAMEKLRRWGANPDLAELMVSRGGTMTFYQALGAIAASKGMYIGGEWADNRQIVIGFGLNRGEIGAVDRVAEGIRYFAGAMKPVKRAGGRVRFDVRHRNAEECSWELRYSPKKGDAQLVKMVHGFTRLTLDFPTLKAALQHVEDNLWCENVIDVEPVDYIEA